MLFFILFDSLFSLDFKALIHNIKIMNILKEVNSFLDDIFQQLSSVAIDFENLESDHVCYRVASIEEYECIKAELIKSHELLIEAPVGGRLISTFKLAQAIEYKNRKIPLLELPEPKKGSAYPTGFEHIEFVIKKDLTSIVNEFPQYSWNTKALHKKLNPEIQLKLNNGLSVKFHNQSLEQVIEIEKLELSQ